MSAPAPAPAHIPRIRWDEIILADLVALADERGISEARVGSRHEALRLRYAIYNFLRRNGRSGTLTITLDETGGVYLTRPVEIQIKESV